MLRLVTLPDDTLPVSGVEQPGPPNLEHDPIIRFESLRLDCQRRSSILLYLRPCEPGLREDETEEVSLHALEEVAEGENVCWFYGSKSARLDAALDV